MIAATPIPTAVPKPGPTAPPAGAAPKLDDAGAAPKLDDAPKVDDAPVAPGGQAADGAKQQAPAPNGGSAPVDAASAAKQAIIEKFQTTSAADAIAQVDGQLTKLSTLSVGGGTPEGLQGTKVATALLTDSSMLLQHAHVKAMEQLRDMATELQMRVMSSVSGLAYMGGQVAMAGQSKTPVKLADIAGGPITETKQIMADVIAAITPKDAPVADAPAAAAGAGAGAPAADAPPAGDAKAPAADPAASRVGTPTGAPTPDATSVPVPSAPNGNTGVAGAVPPRNLQHVTPGPGTGRGPNPA